MLYIESFELCAMRAGRLFLTEKNVSFMEGLQMRSVLVERKGFGDGLGVRGICAMCKLSG